MIIYDKKLFGLNLIGRVHGSAVYRSILPGLLSIGCLLLFRKVYREHYMLATLGIHIEDREDEDIQHPYAIGMLVASTTFLIIFRANQGYARYWEGCTATHHMMSKWMDSTMHTAVFHMQCEHYNSIKPPSYFDHPHLDSMFLTRARERVVTSMNNILNDNDNTEKRDSNKERSSSFSFKKGGAGAGDHSESSMASGAHRARRSYMEKRAYIKSIEAPSRKSVRKLNKKMEGEIYHDKDHPLKRNKPKNFLETLRSADGDGDNGDNHTGGFNINDYYSSGSSGPRPLQGLGRLDGNWGNLFPEQKNATYFNRNEHGDNYLFECSDAMQLPSFASYQGGRTPSLFLQELAHLSSLMVAVAFSTLRNDMEGSMSPLGVYEPGQPWPEVDSDKIKGLSFEGPWYKRYWHKFIYVMGVGKSAAERTRYNAMRPMPVIGGVSDNEILFLQMARGPYAKTQLCWCWLSEFIMREHLAGSLGKVGPPIVSRIIQFLSDGMIFYNHARKVMFIPFPFPHAQLSALFVLITIPAIAFLMEQYAENLIVGSILTFLSVVCLSGVHEVARELENPFRNIPNEVPLVTMLAQYNESLITMFSGYHPDHFWDPKDYTMEPHPTPTTHDDDDDDDDMYSVDSQQHVEDHEKKKNDDKEENNNIPQQQVPRKSPPMSPPAELRASTTATAANNNNQETIIIQNNNNNDDDKNNKRDANDNQPISSSSPPMSLAEFRPSTTDTKIQSSNTTDNGEKDNNNFRNEENPISPPMSPAEFRPSNKPTTTTIMEPVNDHDDNHKRIDHVEIANLTIETTTTAEQTRIHNKNNNTNINSTFRPIQKDSADSSLSGGENEHDDDDDDYQISYLEKKMEEFHQELERLKIKRRQKRKTK